jgi:hypothetical protein
MSADVAEPTADRAPVVDRAGRVLTEFTERFKELAHHLGDRKTQPEAIERFRAIRPPAEEFARQVSAEIEVGRASDLEKAELWLRLADFEFYLLKCARRAGQGGENAAARSNTPAKQPRRPWVVHTPEGD